MGGETPVKNIPGWRYLTKKELDQAIIDDSVWDYHMVDGKIYTSTTNSLQILVGEWLSALMTIWLHDRTERIKGEFTALTGEDAEKILKEWGWLDEKGQPTGR